MAPKKSYTVAEPFGIGELCLAKIKGYVDWPAKVTGSTGKGKYSVVFFGTGEVGNVGISKLTKFRISQDKISKYQSRFGYMKAVKEYLIEAANQNPHSKKPQQQQTQPNLCQPKQQKTETRRQKRKQQEQLQSQTLLQSQTQPKQQKIETRQQKRKQQEQLQSQTLSQLQTQPKQQKIQTRQQKRQQQQQELL